MLETKKTGSLLTVSTVLAGAIVLTLGFAGRAELSPEGPLELFGGDPYPCEKASPYPCWTASTKVCKDSTCTITKGFQKYCDTPFYHDQIQVNMTHNVCTNWPTGYLNCTTQSPNPIIVCVKQRPCSTVSCQPDPTRGGGYFCESDPNATTTDLEPMFYDAKVSGTDGTCKGG